MTVKMWKFMYSKTFTIVETLKNVHTDVCEDYRITICELSEECSVSCGTFQPNLSEDLDMARVFAKFVLKLLSADQKEDHFSAALDLLKCSK
ncbi:hypothetical protein AVEN_111617-1 [Araneus ventricosus]|uniref:Uncharacterized protein n=1 Tax=Araneus ventricosus TaxID=182803 RepID=A0A4Y2C313_ARAVE|nr:hypothetical protein AVEN_111617-1 [Araneus ventricosus]